jgi:hypothetical protein
VLVFELLRRLLTLEHKSIYFSSIFTMILQVTLQPPIARPTLTRPVLLANCLGQLVEFQSESEIPGWVIYSKPV